MVTTAEPYPAIARMSMDPAPCRKGVSLVDCVRLLGTLVGNGRRSLKEATVSAAHSASVDRAAPALSIVIPAFNEAQRIELALDRVLQFVGERHLATEVLVVDDGSSDSTGLIVQRYIAAHPDGKV